MIPAYVINLPRDSERLARMKAQFAGLDGFAVTYVNAVDGSTLADSVCEMLTDSGFWSSFKGAIGCFLSHVAVWEQISRQECGYAVVLEDDADLARLGELARLVLPDDFDIVFINERMSPKTGGDGVVDMEAALRAIDLDRAGFGTDGYLLTPVAAAKLVAAAAKDLLYGHIDGRLARYATAPEILERLGDAPVANVLRRHHNTKRMPELGLLKGYAAAMPLVTHGRGPSTREHLDARSKPAADARDPLTRYGNPSMADPPEHEGLIAELEAPERIPRRMPAFVADLSGRGLTPATAPWQDIHGSYLVRREDVLLFGPNHLVSPAGNWSCEARSHKEQFLSYLNQEFYDRMYPGVKPRIVDPARRELRTAGMRLEDVTVLDMPVFLATPMEPPIWGRWIATVLHKVLQFKSHGQGRKLLCHTALDWQKAFLLALGVQEDEILPHDPGRTYICRDLMTVEYSILNMTVSALERANFFEIINRLRVKIAPAPKLFVSRLTRSLKNPHYRVLQNEAALAAALAERRFALVEPETLDFAAQVSLFAAAREVVCLGGSALFNTAFCAPGTRVVTVESSAEYVTGHAALLASLGLEYGVLFGEQDLTDTTPHHKRWTLDVPRAAEVLDRFFAGA